MNPSVTNFYNKESDPDYYLKYEREHGARLRYIFDRYNLKDIKSEKLCDFGGGAGFFIDKFDKSNKRYIIDGAILNKERAKYLEENGIIYLQQDLNNLDGRDYGGECLFHKKFDKGFCLEVAEHVPNLYSLINSIKHIVKIEGEIYISIPHIDCEHLVLYPGLFYPVENFITFLNQMALPVQDMVESRHSFPSWIFKCLNKCWDEKIVQWPKPDLKYKYVGILEMINT